MPRFRFSPLRSSLPALAAALLLLAAGPAARAQDRPLKIGFVDVAAISVESRAIRSEILSANAELRKKQEELETILQPYRQRRADLEKQRDILKPEKIASEEQVLKEMETRARALQQEVADYIRARQKDLVDPSVVRITETINRVAKEQGFDLVLRADAVVFSIDALDLTPKVVAVLDAGLPPEATAPK